MGSLENHHGVGLILKTCRKNAMLNVRVHGAHGNSPEDRAVWTLDSILQKKCKKEMFVMAKVQSRDFPDVTHDAPCDAPVSNLNAQSFNGYRKTRQSVELVLEAVDDQLRE